MLVTGPTGATAGADADDRRGLLRDTSASDPTLEQTSRHALDEDEDGPEDEEQEEEDGLPFSAAPLVPVPLFSACRRRGTRCTLSPSLAR
jgi:hypothetical protein